MSYRPRHQATILLPSELDSTEPTASNLRPLSLKRVFLDQTNPVQRWVQLSVCIHSSACQSRGITHNCTPAYTAGRPYRAPTLP